MSDPPARWETILRASPYVLALLLVALAAIGRRGGTLPDTDCWMRLHRVENLHAGQGWYDGSVPRSNAPYGTTLHWTRPLDALLLGGASVGAVFTDFRSSLFAWGSAISPLLEIATLLLLAWALRPVLARAEVLLVQVLFALTSSVVAYFGWGRADHHSLLMLLFVAAIGFAVRSARRPDAPGASRAAGLVVAAAIWVSPEGLLSMAVVAGALGFLWLAEPEAYLRANLRFYASLLVGLLVALAIERPPREWLDAELDRLSVVHVAAALLPALFWGAVALRARAFERGVLRTPARRALAAAVGAGVAAGALGLLFPSLWSGPSAWLDRQVRELWEVHVREVQPLYGSEGGFVERALRVASGLPCVLGLLGIVPALRRARSPEARRGLAVLAVAALAATPLGFARIRWTGYAAIALLPFHVSLFFALLDSARRLATTARVAATAALVVVFAFAGEIAWFVRAEAAGADASASPASDVTLADLCRAIEANPRFARPVAILAPIDDGPEVLWRTRHSVVATPHHRNRDGILDAIRAFAAPDDAAALEVVRARGVRLMWVRTRPSAPAAYRRDDGRPSFYERLGRGEAPPWAVPVPLPDDVAALFRAYECTPP